MERSWPTGSGSPGREGREGGGGGRGRGMVREKEWPWSEGGGGGEVFQNLKGRVSDDHQGGKTSWLFRPACRLRPVGTSRLGETMTQEPHYEDNMIHARDE
jgi:hypothetical protein